MNKKKSIDIEKGGIIKFPSWYDRNKRHFLTGIPWFNPQRKVFVCAKHILNMRTRQEFITEWIKRKYDPNEVGWIAADISILLGQRYEWWPTYYFYPEDCVEIILQSFLCEDPEDPCDLIRSFFSIPRKVHKDEYPFYDLCWYGGRMFQLVDMIIEIRRIEESGRKGLFL